MHRLVLVLACVCAQAVALDVPTGVVALASADPQGDPGASAVVVADGVAVTLAEVLPAGAATAALVVPPGRRREARIERRGELALLRFDTSGLTPVAPAARAAAPGDEVWTAGNAVGALALDGSPALSRGIVSGRYALPAGGPPLRGRGGRVVSTLTGEVLEIDAAVNEGSQGGALLDREGRLVGLVALAQARERRLGTALPLARFAAAAGLPAPAPAPASSASAPVALVRLERPNGLGNPPAPPRPPRSVDEVPPYERGRVQRGWDMHYHFQQIQWTDQPVSAVVIDPARGLLLTAAINCRDGVVRGSVILPDLTTVPCRVLAQDLGLDLALLVADGPLALPGARLATLPAAVGDPVRVVGRHSVDGQPTSTAGQVSVVARRLQKSASHALQVDARCNYGSLGGAVLAADGALLGVVVLLGPQRSWLPNSGVAMAIDAAAIAAALPALEEGRSRAQLPVLGLGVKLAQADGPPRIEAVVPGTGAADAGLRPGDQLVEADGRPLASAPALARVLSRHRAGDRVAITVVRGAQRLQLAVELREFQ